MLRREWTFRSIEAEILIVRGTDLRPGEEAEGSHLALLNIDRWLSEPFQASILAEMCYSSVGVGGADIGPRDQLRARLEEAFGSRTLVVVRPASRMRAVAGSAPVVHQLVRDTSGGRSVSADLAGEGPKHGRRGWEVPGRTVSVMVAAKADLMPGEPFEDAQLPITFLDHWIADVPQRKKLREMYKAVYGPGDAGGHSTTILKTKLADAFRKKELVMLRVTSASGGGGGGGGTPGGDKDDKDEKEAAKAPPKKPVKTWIAFQLADEDGEPVAGERYRLEITDGSVREGSLDSEGQVRVVNIDPGNCVISFPDLDSTEWRPV